MNLMMDQLVGRGDPVPPPDEWTLCRRLAESHGPEGAARIVEAHRATYITRQDFENIKALGLNSVRIPFGYWAVDGPRPGEPYVGPCTEVLDTALTWAEELGLSVVLSFHGTVGCQSDHRASGRETPNW